MFIRNVGYGFTGGFWMTLLNCDDKLPLSFTKNGWSIGQSARMSGALSTRWDPMRSKRTVWPFELSPPPSTVGNDDVEDDCVRESIVSVVTISI